MKSIHQTIRLMMAFVAVLVLSAVCYYANMRPVLAATNGGIAIKVNFKTLTPFDIVTIRGKGFDKNAPASVIFTTKSGETLTIPATKITATSVEVQVPPVGYNKARGAFMRQKVSAKVIQIKEQGQKLAVTTSNTVGGLTISAPRTARALIKAGFKKLPKGTLTYSFLDVARYNLESIMGSLPSGNDKLADSLWNAEKGLTDLMGAARLLINNPKMKVKLERTTGTTVTVDLAVVTRLDAIYSAYLGMAEKKHLMASGGGAFALVPAAHAQEMSTCMRRGTGDAGLSAEEKAIYQVVCAPNDNALELLSLRKLDQWADKMVSSFSGTLGGMLQAADNAEAKLVSEVALLSGYPLNMEMMRVSKKDVLDATNALAKAAGDGLLGIKSGMDGFYDMLQSYDSFRDHLSSQLKSGNVAFVILAEPFLDMPNGFRPDARLIKLNYGTSEAAKVTVRQVEPPVDSTTLIQDSTGIVGDDFDVISTPTGTTPADLGNITNPTVTPEPQPRVCEPDGAVHVANESACSKGCVIVDLHQCYETCVTPAYPYGDHNCNNACYQAYLASLPEESKCRRECRQVHYDSECY